MSRTSRPTKHSKEPAIAKILTIKDAVEDFLDNLVVPEVQATEDNALTILGEFLLTLDTHIRVGEIDIMDRGKGCLTWVQGKALSRVYPLDRERFQGAAKRGQWGPFLKQYWHYSDSTAYWCRRIYETWHDNLQEVKCIGYSGCLEQLAPSFCRDDEGVEPKEPSPSPSSGPEEPQDPPPPPPIGNLLRTLATAAEKLSCATGEMPERFYSPEKQIQLIKDYALTIDSIISNLRRAQDNLQKLEIQAAQQVLDDAQKEQEVGAEMGEINDAT